jgi:cytochrome c-type biogenesis protein CcmH/NrfG
MNNQNTINQLVSKAFIKIKNNDFKSAKQFLKQALEKDKENPDIEYNLAVVLLKEENYLEASKYLVDILNSPLTTVDIIQTKLLLSYTYLKLKDNDKCGGLLISIIKAVPGNIIALSLLGFYYEQIGNIKSAIQTYKNILQFDKENLNAHNSYAYLSATLDQDLNSALQSARLCVKKSPENSAYLDTLGYIYMKMNNSDMARKYLKNAYEISPKSEIIKEHLHKLLKI